jgi:hypothetical protein
MEEFSEKGRNQDGTISKRHLQKMIDLAIEEGTFSLDAIEGVRVLREERDALEAELTVQTGISDERYSQIESLRDELKSVTLERDNARTERDNFKTGARAAEIAVTENEVREAGFCRYERLLEIVFKSPAYRRSGNMPVALDGGGNGCSGFVGTGRFDETTEEI